MEETSTGIYEMSHILYGGVFVKETKAPEGFLLDENAYYVEITENGKIYEVENEAGIGFTNMAQTGSLRIEKDVQRRQGGRLLLPRDRGQRLRPDFQNR